MLSDNHLGRLRQPPWPVGLNGRRACPSGGQSHRPCSLSGFFLGAPQVSATLRAAKNVQMAGLAAHILLHHHGVGTQGQRRAGKDAQPPNPAGCCVHRQRQPCPARPRSTAPDRSDHQGRPHSHRPQKCQTAAAAFAPSAVVPVRGPRNATAQPVPAPRPAPQAAGPPPVPHQPTSDRARSLASRPLEALSCRVSTVISWSLLCNRCGPQ